MPFDDFLTDGQSDAGAAELFSFVQPLKHAENSFEILRVNAESVVFHRKTPFPVAIQSSGDMDPGNAGFLVFDGIADQVLKQLRQLHLVRQDRR